MSTISILLGLVFLALGIWLVGLLLKRKLYRDFPLFLVYAAVSVVGALAKTLAIRNYAIYFYMYWSFEAIGALLALAALYEAYYRVFRNFFRVLRWFWVLFPAAVVLTLIFAIYYAVTRPAIQAVRITSLIIALEIGVNLIQFAIFLLFWGAMLFFHARRRNYPLGIVNGFAVLAVAGLLYAMRSEFGTKFTFLVQYGVPVAYILAEVVWLDAFLRPAELPPQLPQGMTLEQALEEMARSAEEAKEEVKDLSRRLRR